MKDKHSTTEKSEKLSDVAGLERQWKAIDWNRVEGDVNRLQVRIAKATLEKKHNTVKRLQYLLTHSFSAKLLAVKHVTTNKGKRTAGVDGIRWATPADKMHAALTLTDKHYKAQPLKRVYIEKKGKSKKRPLGIPTMYDRAMQALYALALDPVAETTADHRSFGFRKGRCCQDACEHLFQLLSTQNSPQWVLEGDIKGCFDHISHEWLMENISMDKSVLRQFLKAGFVYSKQMFSTDKGTPQGGIISPILANMTLDGMEDALDKEFHKTQDDRFANKVNLVRYWHTKGLRHWVFCTERIELKTAGHTPIVRHVKIRSNANPYLEPEYFEKRKFQNGMRRLSGKFKAVWRKQKGICPVCGKTIDLAEDRKIHFRIPRSQGGTDTVDNMVYMHKDCEKQIQSRRATA